jgi:hypothetical protein
MSERSLILYEEIITCQRKYSLNQPEFEEQKIEHIINMLNFKGVRKLTICGSIFQLYKLLEYQFNPENYLYSYRIIPWLFEMIPDLL